MFLLTKSINVELSDTYRNQMVMIEASRTCRWYMWYILSKYTQKSSSPRKKSWSRYLSPNIFPSSFDIRRYHLCKLNICVPRLFSSSSVTNGFPCWNGVIVRATGIFASTCPVASSSVNPVSERNIAACRSAWSCTSVGCRSGNPGTRRGSSSFCCVPSWGMVLPLFSSDFSPCEPLSEYDHSPRVSFSILVGCLGLREAFSLVLEVPFPSTGGL